MIERYAERSSSLLIRSCLVLAAGQYRGISQRKWRLLQPLFDASLRTVGNIVYLRGLAGPALSAALVMSCVVQAQESAPPHQGAAATHIPQEQVQKNVAVPCLEPPPLVRWEDYQGKFEKTRRNIGSKVGAQICACTPLL